jgi:glutaconate CoA-transferase subunit A
MGRSKLTQMRDAIARFVPDGASVCMGTALEASIPFAAGHELIRQRKRDLTLIAPISDMLFDQLIGAGCASRVVAAWVGNVSAGLGYNYRRATEQGTLAVEDQSNLTIAMGLLAGSLGAPYIPTRSLLGTGLVESNPRLLRAADPWTGAPLVLVPALTPDVTIVHVQRADAQGHAHCWGTLGVTREAALAARSVIVVAEEIVSTDAILGDPNLVLVPSFKVVAVVHAPWGAYPSPVQGCYGRAHDVYARYHAESKTPEGFQRWLATSVLDVADGAPAPDARARVAVRDRRPSVPLDYGY